MAAAVRKSPGRSRVLLQTGGWGLLGLGVLTVGYSVWAFTESRAYLNEVEDSGQMVEAFDAANYLMTSSGLYLLVGVLLTALGGLYLTRPTSSLDKDSPSDQDKPAVPTTSNTTKSPTHTGQAATPTGEDELDEDELEEILRGTDDKPELTEPDNGKFSARPE